MKYKILFTFLFVFLSLFVFAQKDTDSLKHIPDFDYHYKMIYKKPIFKNLKMIGKVDKLGAKGFYGKLLRTLRFKNITDLVEKRYQLPKNLLLAMIMQETGGASILPNGQGDGGLGICHMQGKTAEEFGLKTICDKSCNFVCEKHGKQLNKIIKKHKNNFQKLIRIDDRFHPILNIDAVARHLTYYREGEMNLKGLKKAMKVFTGKRNFKNYWKNIEFYRKELDKKKHLDSLKKRFNKQNKNLLVNGNKGNLKEYLRVSRLVHYNFGLKSYEKFFEKKTKTKTITLFKKDTYLIVKEEKNPENNFQYKYTVGEDYDYERIKKLLEDIVKIKDFKDSFIKKDTIYKIQIMASNKLISSFKKLDKLGIDVQVYKLDKDKKCPYKYMIEHEYSKKNIQEKIKNINQVAGYEDAFIKQGIFYKVQIMASKKSLIKNKKAFSSIFKVLSKHKKKFIE